ncbi:hypothetical protein HYX18_00625 [Candidatus Woesearchaeota archaeon]|nr:hypothetical protein [Candidatus Woesearchaeota archaeon]
MANVVWLKDVSSEEIGIIGYKASKLNMLWQNSFSIPHSFIVTIQAFQYFLDNRSLLKDIKKILEKTSLDKESLLNASESIQELILNCEIPDSVKEDFIYAYSHMNMDTDIIKMLNKNALNFIKAGRDFPYLALRPSFNVNGLKGKYFLNVKGKDNIFNAIKQIWASAFNHDNIPLLKNMKFDDFGIAILSQKMINSEKYALINVNGNELNIDCVYGLGESFSITIPDSYLVNANSIELINKVVNRQDAMFIRDDNYGRTIRKSLNNETAGKEKLSYDEVRKLSNFSLSLYNLYNKDISIEVAIENGKFYLIDVNEEPLMQQTTPQFSINETIPETQTFQASDTITKDMFSMFGNETQSLQGNKNQYSFTEAVNNETSASYSNSANKFISQNLKVPISFDIKITDSTDIEELKQKLRAIKEFINREF